MPDNLWKYSKKCTIFEDEKGYLILADWNHNPTKYTEIKQYSVYELKNKCILELNEYIRDTNLATYLCNKYELWKKDSKGYFEMIFRQIPINLNLDYTNCKNKKDYMTLNDFDQKCFEKNY